MSLSNYLEEKILNHVFRSVTYTPPTTIYVAFFSVAPDDASAGTEITGGSYARQPAAFDAAVNPDGKISTSATLTFLNMPAATIVASATMDAITGGNILTYSVLGSPYTTTAGENISVAAGALNIYVG